MKYTVVWRNLALQQLANIWMQAADRESVNIAVDYVDDELSNDPAQKGEDYFGDRFVLHPVMWALYRIEEAALRVEVLQVGRHGLDLPHDELE